MSSFLLVYEPLEVRNPFVHSSLAPNSALYEVNAINMELDWNLSRDFSPSAYVLVLGAVEGL